ncbi:MAG: type II toxin-antitoxin system HicB family antitoxin [Clostridiales bacterium]|jgi:predicted RNase H-like HicB family nuclease/DNA-binding XRE family transcriptional regulator|nr:type II toxin-antitoxin system HicB family antitoxin [Clostridiales bacterium]
MDTKTKIYPAVIEKDGDYYVVSFPDLPGCFTQGETVEAAYIYAKEALALYLDGLKNCPEPTNIFTIQKPADGCVMLVEAGDVDGIVYFKNNEVPRIINERIQKSGYSKYKVAKILGVSESYINRISKGERVPSPDMAKRIGMLLDFDWQVFYA